MTKKRLAEYKMRGDTYVKFFYHEVILHYLSGYENGRSVSQIAEACALRYDTVRTNLRMLEEMNRVRQELRLQRPRNRKITYWISNKWSINNAKKRIFHRAKPPPEFEF